MKTSASRQRSCCVRPGLLLFAVLTSACLVFPSHAPATPGGTFVWSSLPEPPPPRLGFVAGVSGGALIAHFPDGTLRALAPSDSSWAVVDSGLAFPQWAAIAGDGATLYAIGGLSRGRASREILALRLGQGKVRITRLTDLPEPRAFAGATVARGRLYVVGGVVANQPLVLAENMLVLDLGTGTWAQLPGPPGAGRLLPVVISLGDRLLCSGGFGLARDADGETRLSPLHESSVWTPGEGWKPVRANPVPVASGLAVRYASTGAILLPIRHLPSSTTLPPLTVSTGPSVLWYYDAIVDAWTPADTLPADLDPTHLLAANEGVVVLGHRESLGTGQAWLGKPAVPPHSFRTLDYIALAIYFAGLVFLGFYFARGERSTEDFFLAGRRIPWWAAGLSIFGTQLSAITYMAVPAKSFATDWTFYLSPVCILLVTPLLVRYYLPLFRDLNVTTAYEYLEHRFGLSMRVFGSAVFTLFQLGRIAIVLFLPALALSTVTGMNVLTSVLLMGFIAILYTVLGGIEAVIWTDVLQVIVLLGGAFLSLGLVFTRVEGGLPGLFTQAAAQGKFHMFNWTWDATVASVWVIILGNFFAQLAPYTTDQAVIQRYLTTPDRRAAEKGIWLNALMSLPASGLFFLLGTALYVFYRQHPSALHPGLSTDAIFPWFIVQQLPVGISGILVAGLFAASMSSLDSSMNSVATVIVTDYVRRFRSVLDERRALRLARFITVAVGLFGTATAAAMALYHISSLWDVFLRLLSFMGGALAGVFVLAVFTKRANAPGALVGSALAVAVLVWVQTSTPIHFFLHAAIGSGTCIVGGYLASLLFRGHGNERQRRVG